MDRAAADGGTTTYGAQHREHTPCQSPGCAAGQLRLAAPAAAAAAGAAGQVACRPWAVPLPGLPPATLYAHVPHVINSAPPGGRPYLAWPAAAAVLHAHYPIPLLKDLLIAIPPPPADCQPISGCVPRASQGDSGAGRDRVHHPAAPRPPVPGGAPGCDRQPSQAPTQGTAPKVGGGAAAQACAGRPVEEEGAAAASLPHRLPTPGGGAAARQQGGAAGASGDEGLVPACSVPRAAC